MSEEKKEKMPPENWQFSKDMLSKPLPEWAEWMERALKTKCKPVFGRNTFCILALKTREANRRKALKTKGETNE